MSVLMPFLSNEICLHIVEWINNGDIHVYFEEKCTQSSSSMHKKEDIDRLADS